MSDMTQRQKQMWLDFVTTFLGDECVTYIRAHPSEPKMEIAQGEILLGDILDEEVRFLYSLLPSEANCQKVLAWSIPAVTMLWDVWWLLVADKYRLVGNLGIRKGWVLVQLKQEDPFGELERALKGEMVGRFEFKKEKEEKILPS